MQCIDEQAPELALIWLAPFLNVQDLLPLPKRMEAETVNQIGEQFFDEQRLSIQTGKNSPRLSRAIISAFGIAWGRAAILHALSIACILLFPIFIQQAVYFLSARAAQDPGIAADLNSKLYFSSGVGLAFVLAGIQAGKSILAQAAQSIMRELQIDIRTLFISMIYKRSLVLTPDEAAQFPAGKIMNMINVDSENVSATVQSSHEFWATPIQLVLSVYLLIRFLGTAVWGGVAAMVVLLVLQSFILPFLFKYAGAEMKVNDSRFNHIRELLKGIRNLKASAYECVLTENADKARLQQLGYIRFENFYRADQYCSSTLDIFCDLLIKYGDLDAAMVFPALLLFSQLLEPMGSLPRIWSRFVGARVAWLRINELLAISAINVEIRMETHGKSKPSDRDFAVSLTAASFIWPTAPDADEQSKSPAGTLEINLDKKIVSPYLDSINVDIKKGELTVVIGKVGSGKSAFLSAIAGEMTRTSGKVFLSGTVAYCAQTPWLPSGTVKENITLGLDVDEVRLEKTAVACALSPDLALLPGGIDANVGEDGSNLSGGQKARLALARALYQTADIYLLDDPLSALDARVSKDVFQTAICTQLAGKTRIMVTNNLSIALSADSVILMDDGKVICHGSPDEVASMGGLLNDFISNMPNDEAELDGKTSKEDATEVTEAEQPERSDQDDGPTEIFAEETSAKGGVSWKVYRSYVRAMGGWPVVALVCAVLLLQQGAWVMSQLWLSWWQEKKFGLSGHTYLVYYAVVNSIVCVFLVLGNLAVVAATFRACKTYHALALTNISRAPISFFETQPIGRILNRFSKDMQTIDHQLYIMIFNVITGVFILIGLVGITVYPSAWLLLMVGPLAVVYYFLYRFYRGSVLDFKRLDSVNRSPLYAFVSESLSGRAIIRLSGLTSHFALRQLRLLNQTNQPNYHYLSAQIWIILRIEVLASLLTLALMLVGIAVGSQASLVGLALSASFTLTSEINAMIRSATEMETCMNSVERLDEYCYGLNQEGPKTLKTDPLDWPTTGQLTVERLSVVYPSRPDQPALKDISFELAAGEKMMIVGRTGSGKSTLLQALLRMVPYDGHISIDALDIAQLGLDTLRRGLHTISQTPTLFSGTVRSNLLVHESLQSAKPAEETDRELWAALEKVHLKPFLASTTQKLDHPIEEGGANLSVGQRQLLCIARAIICKTKVLLLDESTSAMDVEAQAVLKDVVLNDEFKDATVVCISHRLADVVAYDRVMVLDQGSIVEMGPPSQLLENPTSKLALLCSSLN
ncbi:Multidrug resistance-associated protein 1 [Gaertneriomyces sp. JEL0708]|nr:Multidrug resistance-associated protein 1 [Gaertneriomyces sp. JEL0708]